MNKIVIESKIVKENPNYDKIVNKSITIFSFYFV